MSMFGQGPKNDLYDALLEFYHYGGSSVDLFDTLKHAAEYSHTPESVLRERIDNAIEELSKGINFCENDSQGAYDVCNKAIAREKRVLAILKGE